MLSDPHVRYKIRGDTTQIFSLASSSFCVAFVPLYLSHPYKQDRVALSPFNSAALRWVCVGQSTDLHFELTR